MSGWYVIPWCWSTNIRDLNSISIRIDGVCVDYQTIKWAPVNLSRKSSVINAMHVVHKHFKGVSKWHQLAVWASEALVLGNYHVASWISMRLWLITGYSMQSLNTMALQCSCQTVMLDCGLVGGTVALMYFWCQEDDSKSEFIKG